MNVDETHFKIIAAVLFLAYGVVRFYFQRGQQNIKTVEVHHKGREWLLHNMVVLALTPFVLYLLTPWLQVFHITLPTWLRWLGALIFFRGRYPS